MGNCNDPFVTYLKSVGYNAIRLPRANIKPLQILAKAGRDLTWLGDVGDIFTSSPPADVPQIQNDVSATDVNGKRSGDLSIGIGVSILGSIIGAMGGSKLGLDLTYKNAKSAVFEFSDVLTDLVALTKVDQYLGKSDVNPSNVGISKLLDADEVFVITNTVKSKKFTIETSKSDGTGFEISVPVIQEIVGGDIKVSGNRGHSSKITFEGPVPLVFGLQAIQLYYDKGVYTAFKPLDAGTIAVKALSGVKDDGAQRLITPEPLVRLRMD